MSGTTSGLTGGPLGYSIPVQGGQPIQLSGLTSSPFTQYALPTTSLASPGGDAGGTPSSYAVTDFQSTPFAYQYPNGIPASFVSGLDLTTPLGVDTLAARIMGNQANAAPYDPSGNFPGSFSFMPSVGNYSMTPAFAGSPNYTISGSGYADPTASYANQLQADWAAQLKATEGPPWWTGLLALAAPLAVGVGAEFLGPALGSAGAAGAADATTAAGTLGSAGAGAAADVSLSDLAGLTAGAGDIGGASAGGAAAAAAPSVAAAVGDVGAGAGAAGSAVTDLAGLTYAPGVGLTDAAGNLITDPGLLFGGAGGASAGGGGVVGGTGGALPGGGGAAVGADTTGGLGSAADTGSTVLTSADAPAAGSSFWSDLFGNTDTIGGLLNSPVARLAGMGLSGIGLASSLFKGNTPVQGQAPLSSIAGQAATQGQQLASYLQSGNLPPGVQQAINQGVQSAKAAIRSRYASMGISGSSAEAADLANVENMAVSQGAGIAQNLLQTGITETNLAANIYTTLMNNAVKQNQILSQSIGNFAAALAGQPRQTTTAPVA